MATSGTTTFDLDIDDIIEEAYERCAVRTNSCRDLKSALPFGEPLPMISA